MMQSTHGWSSRAHEQLEQWSPHKVGTSVIQEWLEQFSVGVVQAVQSSSGIGKSRHSWSSAIQEQLKQCNLDTAGPVQSRNDWNSVM